MPGQDWIKKKKKLSFVFTYVTIFCFLVSYYHGEFFGDDTGPAEAGGGFGGGDDVWHVHAHDERLQCQVHTHEIQRRGAGQGRGSVPWQVTEKHIKVVRNKSNLWLVNYYKLV